MKNSFSNLWNSFWRNKWLLLLCFVLAFLSWQSIRKNIGFEVSVSNVLVDVDVPEGWAVWEKSMQRVNVVFRGSREDIRYLNNEQLRVVIPMSAPEHGQETSVVLSEKYLRNPTSAKVVRFSPSDIVVKLDQKSTRKLPVKAAFNGTLPEGLEIDRIICSPASVSVTGAKKVLDEMENIHTQPVELKDRTVSFKESVPIALPQIGRMEAEPDWVTVELVLEQRSSTQTFESVDVRVLCSASEKRTFSVLPEVIAVTVKGQQQRIEKLRSADIFAYVSCSELKENTGYDLPVVVDLPAGIQLVKSEPSVVHVDIEN